MEKTTLKYELKPYARGKDGELILVADNAPQDLNFAYLGFREFEDIFIEDFDSVLRKNIIEPYEDYVTGNIKITITIENTLKHE